ncbi:MAG TPA: ATP-dependent DNA helicase [Candidatus Desulfofervidus auxilii]|uniref:DNA 5'-3' helicase n=1 Tax=Desulfofervidus auxilii TaxID=1621989 RepID=A0A7V0I9Q8_DESA2|nr:ATP-dependent DNA helicase [Candidatus Desulfofervidus auxilii]
MLSEIFGPNGILAKKLPNFEWRPSQLVMAKEIAIALDKKEKIIIEAGTGTGKTLAYIIPAMLSGKKIIISTGTKSLQNQLFYKDIPLLEKIFGEKPQAIYLKGRRNYLCLWRYQLVSSKLLIQSNEMKIIKHWVNNTKTGDIAEVPVSPEWKGWADLTANAEQCLWHKCPFWEICFITQMKLLALKAKMIIVNHYLFVADMALKDKRNRQVLPSYEAVIFDEAHQLEGIISEHFGLQVSNLRIAELIRDISFLFEKRTPDEIRNELNALMDKNNKFFDLFTNLSGRKSLKEITSSATFNQSIDILKKVLERIIKIVQKSDASPEVKENLKDRAKRIKDDLGFISTQSDPDYAYWIEKRKRNITMGCSPLRVDHILRNILYPAVQSIVFTSATINTGDNFFFFKEQLGLPPDTKGVLLASPFDYKNQALLYIPPFMPDPNSTDFLKAVIKEIIKILYISKGRALILFTSLKNMKETYEKVAPQIPFPAIIQGEQSSPKLLEIFKKNIHSVLFATASFWEGIDVPGEALSCVIVDRLPFAVPDDPLMQARLNLLKKIGKNPFWSYQVPKAIIALRQGLGRLIRHRQDKGLLAKLDPRLFTRSYGRHFLKNLPPCHITRDLKDVEKFFKTF